MAATTLNISLTPELRASIEARVRTGLYNNASDVVRAGLRTLTREEVAASYRDFRRIMARLPQEPITPELEQEIVGAIRKSRAAEKRGTTK